MKLFGAMLTALGLLAATAAAEGQSPALPGYLGSAACADCHQDEAAAWARSDHARSWHAPDAALIPEGRQGGISVIHDTDGAKVAWPEAEPPKPPARITGVLGSGPQHRYLTAGSSGALALPGFAWNGNTGDWEKPAPDTAPTADLHSAQPAVWNSGCAVCHATDFTRNYDPVSETYDSRWTEAGIGCESCHGPGEAHADWASLQDDFDHAAWSGVDLQGLMPLAEHDIGASEACAGCHARASSLTGNSQPAGAAFGDSFALHLLEPGLYFPDGQPQGETLTYGAFLQSAKQEAGVTCTDCHAPHTASLRAEGNALCTTCHSSDGNARFPAVTRAEYDSPAHHFHPAGSEGAQCVACHMPASDVWTGRKHDHAFRIPRPDLNAATGTPDACTTCHADRSPEWAATELKTRFPGSRHHGPHFGEVLALARTDAAAQAEALADLALEPSLPGIVRATALSLLKGIRRVEVADRVAPLLGDPDPLIRAAAAGTQLGIAPAERIQRLAPLLGDDLLAVRLAAVREFLAAPRMNYPERLQRNFDTAVAELRNSLNAMADSPQAQFDLGLLERQTGNYPKAALALQKAVEMDPEHVESWVWLLQTEVDLGLTARARETLDTALKHAPDNKDLLRLARRLDP